MNEESFTNRAQSRIPSDDQMDSLLRDFFRLEVPTELNRPLRRNPAANAAAATLTLAPEHRVGPRRTQSARFVGVAASVAAMALAVLVHISGNNEPAANGKRVAGGDPDSFATTPESDKQMLVSPHGDFRASTRVIGPDGVTLEETDIELHPQK